MCGNNIWDTKTHTHTHTIRQSEKQNGKRQRGVVFTVIKVMNRNIMAFTHISKGMRTLRIKTKSIINVYAPPPTEDGEETEKEEFYSQLERPYDNVPSNEMKTINGDLNAKLGREEISRAIIGKESLHLISNNNGLRATSFAMSRNMTISSIHFPHQNMYKQRYLKSL